MEGAVGCVADSELNEEAWDDAEEVGVVVEASLEEFDGSLVSIGRPVLFVCLFQFKKYNSVQSVARRTLHRVK